MRERLVPLARGGLALLILWYVGRVIIRNWGDLQQQPIAWTFRPLPALASLLLVWLMYGVLIEAWRRMLEGWGQRLDRPAAARIWVLSSLGKYIPGKVWAIAGMAIMAKDRGVAPWAATASAVILQALAIGTGAITAAAFGSQAIRSQQPGLLIWFWLAGAGGILGVAGLMYPPLLRRMLQLVRLDPAAPTPGSSPILLGLASNLIAWLGYGTSLWMLGRAVLPVDSLTLGVAIAAFAASYVAGLVVLLAPGGLVVREGVMLALLQGSIGIGPAAALVVASRVLLTITELGAAVPFLLFRSERARVV